MIWQKRHETGLSYHFYLFFPQILKNRTVCNTKPYVFLFQPPHSGTNTSGFAIKTILYYFTGTGNSLAAARGIARGIENCELVSIASAGE